MTLRVDGDANPNQLVLTGAGNVGIGTTSPTEKLDVNGYIISSGSISVQNPAKSSASTFTSPQEIMDAGWAEGNGLYYINPGGQLGASVQVYCDFTTRDYKGETGWMLVASWATDYTWPTNTSTTTGVLGSTAADRWSANFGNFEVQDFRVHAGPTVDSGGSNSSDDWYYHRDSPIAWKKWWSPSSGATGLYPRSTTTNPSIRDGIIGFDWSHNLKFNYRNTAHKSNGMSDAAGTIDFWTALTTNGQSININGIAGDGSFAWATSLANTGQDVSGQQGMVGYDDTSPTYYYGPAVSSTGGQQGASTTSTKLWLWVKGVSKNNLWSNNPTSTDIYSSNTSAKVGIGTTSPNTKLAIVGSSGNPGLEFDNGSTYTYIQSYDRVASAHKDLYIYTTGAPTVVFNTSGNVGIGSTAPAYALDVAGTIRATGDVIAYSDARVKDNVQTVENALSTITSLRGVSYTRNDSEDKSRKVGVIAQEVLPILPEVVQQDANGNYSVAYGNIVGVLIEAIKEQQQQIDELKYLLQTINK
jgi:hypothetical protein